MTIRRAIAAVCACAAALAACTYRPAQEPPDGDASERPRRGGTLVVALSDDAGVLDPQLAAQPGAFALIRATQRGLMAFPGPADPAAVAAPVPDLAARPPEVSPDGLTVTFALRSGPAFGPPASRPVRAADVKAGIERALLIGAAPGPSLRVIDGAAEFVAGRAPTVTGIQTPDDRTVRFRLTAPANDLTWMLAHTGASAVPAGTPRAIAPVDLAASGPYRLERAAAGREIRLVRNETWVAASDPVRGAYVDEISVRVGASSAADLTGDAVEAPAGASIHDVDGGCLLYLFIRPEGSFAARDARAGVSLAVDRGGVVAALAALSRDATVRPTVSLLPPVVTGATPRPVPAADPARARQLLGGPVTVALGREASGPDAPADRAAAEAIGRMLAAAGVTATPLTVPAPGSIYDTYEQGRAPMGVARWCPDWPGRSVRTMVGALAGTGGPANYSGTADPVLDGLIAAALAERDPDRVAAATAAAEARALAIATIIPLAFLPDRVAVSGRVRGFAPHPLFVRGDPANVWLAEAAPSPTPRPAPGGSTPPGASSIAVRYTFPVPTTNGGML